jgi:acetyl-CoA acetyltransferase
LSGASVHAIGEAQIVGVGELIPDEGTSPDEEVLLFEAVQAAADDAGISISEIDGVCIPDAKLALKAHNLECLSGGTLRFQAISPLEGPAGIAWGLRTAAQAVLDGFARVVVIYYGRNQRSQPQKLSPLAFHADDVFKASFEIPYGWYPQVAYMASAFNRHQHLYGTRVESLATVAVAMRSHSALHPRARRRGPYTVGDYYNSRVVSEPFRVADCSLVTDGAGALLLTTKERARECRRPPVSLIASSLGHARDRYHYATADPYLEGAGRDASDIFQISGIKRTEIDLLYLFDPFTFTVLQHFEELGFCERGEGGPYVESVGIGPGSRQPVNTHGGCLAHAHTTGMNHLVEAVIQLRGEAGDRQVAGAQTALYSGYLWRDWCNVILARS